MQKMEGVVGQEHHYHVLLACLFRPTCLTRSQPRLGLDWHEEALRYPRGYDVHASGYCLSPLTPTREDVQNLLKRCLTLTWEGNHTGGFHNRGVSEVLKGEGEGKKGYVENRNCAIIARPCGSLIVRGERRGTEVGGHGWPRGLRGVYMQLLGKLRARRVFGAL